MGLTKHKTPEAAPAAVETTKKATAAAVAAEATPVDVSEIGKKSGTIAFVAPLGDPSHADNTYTKGANGENIKALQELKTEGEGTDPEKVKMVYGKAEAIARIAKQMVNNADVVLRKDKLMAEGKLGKESAIGKLVGA